MTDRLTDGQTFRRRQTPRFAVRLAVKSRQENQRLTDWRDDEQQRNEREPRRHHSEKSSAASGTAERDLFAHSSAADRLTA